MKTRRLGGLLAALIAVVVLVVLLVTLGEESPKIAPPGPVANEQPAKQPPPALPLASERPQPEPVQPTFPAEPPVQPEVLPPVDAEVPEYGSDAWHDVPVPGLTLHGVVVYQGSEDPCPGAEVTIETTNNAAMYEAEETQWRGNKGTFGTAKSYGGGKTWETVTLTVGEQGTFQLRGLKAGTYKISVADPGHADRRSRKSGWVTFTTSHEDGRAVKRKSSEPAEQEVSISKDNAKEPLRLELPRRATVIFRLSPASAKPVQVQLSDLTRGGALNSFPTSQLKRLTSIDGMYRLTHVMEEYDQLTVAAEGFSPIRVNIAPKDGETLDLGTLTLLPGYRVWGKVFFPPGVTPEVSLVTLSPGRPRLETLLAEVEPGRAPGLGARDDHRSIKEIGGQSTTLTDSAGRFEFTSLGEGTYTVWAKHKGFSPAGVTATVSADLPAMYVTITLLMGGTVNGLVHYPPGFAPERFADPSKGVSEEDTQNRTHWFAISYSEEAFVGLIPSGYTPESSFRGEENERRSAARDSGLRAELTKSGKFSITRIPPGSYSAVAVCGDHVSARQELLVKNGGTLTIEFTFPKEVIGSVSGEIIGRDGTPARGLEVTAMSNSANRFGFIDRSNKKSATTDNMGRYLIDGLKAGRYEIEVQGENSSTGLRDPVGREFEISEANFTAIVNVSLVSKGITVRGKALVEGKPVFKTAGLYSVEGRRGSYENTVDSEGNFVIYDVAPYSYYLWLHEDHWGEGKLIGRVPLVVGKDAKEVVSDHNFKLTKLSGTISPRPPAGTVVALTLVPQYDLSLGGDSLMNEDRIGIDADAEGKFEFPQVIAGKFLLKATLEGYAPYEQELDLSGDVVHPVVFGDKAAKVEILVTKIDGEVEVTGPLGSMTWLAIARQDGSAVDIPESARLYRHGIAKGTRMRVPDLPPGRYIVTLTNKHIEDITAEVEFVAGETSVKEVTVYPAAAIRIEFTNPEITAEQISKCGIWCYDDAHRIKSNGHDDGDFFDSINGKPNNPKNYRICRGLRAGVHEINVRISGYVWYRGHATVERGKMTTVKITMTPGDDAWPGDSKGE